MTPMLTSPYDSVNEEVIIRLKWGQTEYKGRLVSVDSYMNVQLTGTEEFIDGKSTGSLGQVLIRSVTTNSERRTMDADADGPCLPAATTSCGSKEPRATLERIRT